jgi:hypothetical protein
MKTAVSIPDPVFTAAEAAAEELGLSRSALYSRALRRFLARYRQHGVTDRLNAVYGEQRASAERRLLGAAWKQRGVGSEEW